MGEAAAVFYFAALAAALLFMCGLAWLLERLGIE